MTFDKTSRQNRVREALGRIYDQQPPYFREYLRRFQEDPTSRVFAPLAEAYRRLGRVDEAIEICREGLEHHPDFHGGRVALAKCYLDKKRYEEAKLELERVVHAVPENLLAQRLLGETHAILGNLTAALHNYKMAHLLAPSDVTLAEKVHALEKEVQTEDPWDGDELHDEPRVTVASLGSARQSEKSLEASHRSEKSLESGVGAKNSSDVFPSSQGLLDETRSPGGVHPVLANETSQVPFEVSVGMKDPLTDEEVSLLSQENSYVELGLRSPTVDEILGVSGDDESEEAFKIEHVSAIFEERSQKKEKEITTATLGDLYFAQGQFDRALRIFEKLYGQRPLPELLRKMNACRMKMGVDREAMARHRKIEALRTILNRVKNAPKIV